MKYRQVSIIGPNADSCTEAMYRLGEILGKSIADSGRIIICGGKGGMMEAVCKGAQQSDNYHSGMTVGILPGYDRSEANAFCDIVIPSGIGYTRNSLVVSSGDVIIAVAGGVGTLTEIAFAWHYHKPLIAITGFGGWSEKLAGQNLDNRREDSIHKAHSVEEAISLINLWELE